MKLASKLVLDQPALIFVDSENKANLVSHILTLCVGHKYININTNRAHRACFNKYSSNIKWCNQSFNFVCTYDATCEKYDILWSYRQKLGSVDRLVLHESMRLVLNKQLQMWFSTRPLRLIVQPIVPPVVWWFFATVPSHVERLSNSRCISSSLCCKGQNETTLITTRFSPKCAIYHIKVAAKWPSLCRRYFQKFLLEWKSLNFNSNFIETCSFMPNWQTSIS